MSIETYEKLQAELSQLLNTEKYKQLKGKDKEVYKQAVLACKSVASHYAERISKEHKSYNDGYYDGYRDGAYGKAYKIKGGGEEWLNT